MISQPAGLARVLDATYHADRERIKKLLMEDPLLKQTHTIGLTMHEQRELLHKQVARVASAVRFQDVRVYAC